MNANRKLILASSSPRRQEMLRALGLVFEVVVPQIDELPAPGEAPAAFAERAAVDKAEWVRQRLAARREDLLIIAGDTIVVAGGRILGKPRDEADAKAMLCELSGRTHEVMSGLCVLAVSAGRETRRKSVAVRTEVEFKELSVGEIESYVRSGEPMDKAGAYAIQGGANYMIRRIAGSHTNVIGLPLCELIEMLAADFGSDQA